ncbi:hypothetical protein SNEBB_008862 [Seison nebaliae]|nr:hypothetical protein SNEBB_008862 [Seison nebaliae]
MSDEKWKMDQLSLFPSKNYYKQQIGMKLSDDEMTTIPHSDTELWYHINLKVVEGLTVLTGSGALIYRLIRGPRCPSQIIKSIGRCGMVAPIIGFPLGTYISMTKMKTLIDDGIYDRAYRIRRNWFSKSWDIGYIGGAPTGLLLSSLLPKLGRPMHFMFFGCWLGTICGIFYGVQYKSTKREKKSTPPSEEIAK